MENKNVIIHYNHWMDFNRQDLSDPNKKLRVFRGLKLDYQFDSSVEEFCFPWEPFH